MALYIYAPNVHQGGGKVLLDALLSECGLLIDFLVLDQRYDPPVDRNDVYWVDRSFFGRLKSELYLSRTVAENDTVLMFHNLPPVFKLKGRSVVFFQNRLLVESSGHFQGLSWGRIRNFIERSLLKYFLQNAEKYLVQTSTMLRLFNEFAPKKVSVSVRPFLPVYGEIKVKDNERFDFFYPASGDPHKNHLVLIDTWIMLAKSGIRPTLGLTIDSIASTQLCVYVENMKAKFQLEIVNLGVVGHQDTLDVIKSSKALIYPSLMESFGLPLVEARELGIPIIAPELDYVRDVCIPVATFNPASVLSMFRSVCRFLNSKNNNFTEYSAEQFLAEIEL